MRRRYLFTKTQVEDDVVPLALTLTRSIWVLVAAWACTVVLNLTVQYQLYAAVTGLVSVAFLLACLHLVRKRYLQFPVYAIPSALLISITYLAMEGMGLRDEVMLAVPPCILLAALLIGRRGAIAFAGLSLGVVAVLYMGSLRGAFLDPEIQANDTRVLQAYVTILVTSLALLWPAVTSLREALRRARENEAEISSAYAQLNEAQRTAQIGSWEHDAVAHQEVWSEELYRILEIPCDAFPCSREELLGRVHPEDLEKASSVIQEATALAGAAEAVYRLQWPDGRMKVVHERCETRRDASGQPIRTAGTVQDITERKQREEERRQLQGDLLQSQKMESVGRLAGGVAHDFNNLLTAILGFAEMALTRPSGLDPQAIESLRQIYRAGERAKDLTQQLLAFGRKQTLGNQAYRPQCRR